MEGENQVFSKSSGAKLLCRTMSWCCCVAMFLPTLMAQTEELFHLPDSSVVLWKVKPQEVIRSDTGRLLPWEALGAISSDKLGLDVLRVTQFSGAFELSPAGEELYCAHFSPSRSVDLMSLNAQYFEPIRTSEANKLLRRRSWKGREFSVVQMGERWVAGMDKSLKKMREAGGGVHRLNDLFHQSDEAIVVMVDVRRLRNHLPDYLKYFELSAGTEAAGLWKRLCELVDYVELRCDLRSQLSFEMRWVCLDSGKVPEAMDLIEKTFRRGGEWFVTASEDIVRWSNVEGISADLWRSYWRRLFANPSRLLSTSVEDKLIVTRLVHFEELVSVVTLSTMSTIPLEAIENSLPRPRTEANLESLAIALHSYEAVHRRIPPRVIKDKDDKPLLSWRVLLLPYLGEEELFSQFRMDEPWDSEHNKKLLEKMPAVYGNPNADLPRGYTSYLAPYGFVERREQTAWDIEPLLLRQVSDGLANTAAIVEVLPPSAVPWTKPEDFDLRERDLSEFLGEPPTGGLVVMLDTTCYDLSSWKDKRRLKGVLTVQGGEAVTAPF